MAEKMEFSTAWFSVLVIFYFGLISAGPVHHISVALRPSSAVGNASTAVVAGSTEVSAGFCPAEGCLCGWDIGLAVREDSLNQILAKSISKYFGEIPFPELNYHDPPPKHCTDETYLSTGLRINGLKMDNLRFNAVQGLEQTGHLVAHFTAGTVYMSSDYIYTKTGKIAFHGPVRKFNMANGKIAFNTRVTSHRFEFTHEKKDRWTVKYEVVGDDAIVGTIEFMSDISIQQVKPVNQAFTAFMKRMLKKGRVEELGSFEVPKKDPSKSSLIQDLFPHSIRFTLAYQSGGKSVIAALGTGKMKDPDFLNFAAPFLMEQNTGFAFLISGDRFMDVFMRQMNKMVGRDLPIGGHIETTSDCPPKIRNKNRIWLKTQKIAGIFHITPYIKKFSLQLDGNIIRIDVSAWMDFSVWPMQEEIDMTFKFKIGYSSSKKKYSISLHDKSHSLHHHCPEWFKIMKWFNPIVLLANEIIKAIVASLVNSQFWDKIDSILNFGDPIEMPFNIGGPVGEFVKKMSVSQIGIYKGNWLTNFQLNLNQPL